eukprot:6479838-Amphidinium_carterae.1
MVLTHQWHSEVVISFTSTKFYFSNIWLCRVVTGLITGFGLNFLSSMLYGPSKDRATHQLVGTLFVSTLVPGLAREFAAETTKVTGCSLTQGKNA